MLVEAEGKVVHGRPDVYYLLGFQAGEVHTLTVTAAEFAENPDVAVGLAPVFSGVEGEPGNLAVGPAVEFAAYQRA